MTFGSSGIRSKSGVAYMLNGCCEQDQQMQPDGSSLYVHSSVMLTGDAICVNGGIVLFVYEVERDHATSEIAN